MTKGVACADVMGFRYMIGTMRLSVQVPNGERDRTMGFNEINQTR
jgi:hypothetical protein